MSTPTTTTSICWTQVHTPVGPLTLVGDADGLSGVYMSPHRHGPDPTAAGRHDDTPFQEAITQLRAYFSGRRREFDLPLVARGTDFQVAVWQALRTIPYGQTVSYRAVAERVGNPKAVRAVGLAVGRNPLSIVVPCHRVIGADGSLTGYGGGLPRKRWLLEHEGAVFGAHPAPA